MDHFSNSAAKGAHPESDHAKASDKPTLRDFLQKKKWPVILKSVKFIKVKIRELFKTEEY